MRPSLADPIHDRPPDSITLRSLYPRPGGPTSRTESADCCCPSPRRFRDLPCLRTSFRDQTPRIRTNPTERPTRAESREWHRTTGRSPDSDRTLEANLVGLRVQSRREKVKLERCHYLQSSFRTTTEDSGNARVSLSLAETGLGGLPGLPRVFDQNQDSFRSFGAILDFPLLLVAQWGWFEFEAFDPGSLFGGMGGPGIDVATGNSNPLILFVT